MADQTITYNGFAFPFTTLDVDASPAFAEDGITVLHTKYTFNVSGVLSAETTAAFAVLLDTIHAKALAPRKTFSVQWGAVETYGFEPSADDVCFGPHPGDLRIHRFAGGLSALYSWSLTVEKKECWSDSCSPQGRRSDILSIVRRYEHNIDANGFTTRTVSGKLVITANAVEAGRSADQFRLWAEPPLGSNYKRESQEYSQSEDGLTLTFSIRDVEVMWSLPAPLTEGRVSWMVRVADRGLRVDYCLSGRFAAPANVSKGTIIARIASLAAAKFPLNQNGVTLIFESRELVEDDLFGCNGISFNICAWSAGGSGGNEFDFFTGLPTIGGRPPGSDGNSQKVGVYGGDGNSNSGVAAGVPKVHDACVGPPPGGGGTSIGGSGGSGGGLGTGGGSGGTGGGSGDHTTQQTSNSNVSSSHKNSPYLAFHETISFELDSGIVTFRPKAKDAAVIHQQTAVPTMVVVQAGYAIRVVSPPTVPQPYYPADKAIMLRPYVSTSTPEPIGATGLNSYKTEWRYVMSFKAAVKTSAEIGIGYGNDPRTQEEATLRGPPLSGLPELVGKVE